jgi:hypothetical protein
MGLGKLEETLQDWERRMAKGENQIPKKYRVKQSELTKLKKHIDKIYAMYSKINQYEEKVTAWTKGE